MQKNCLFGLLIFHEGGESKKQSVATVMQMSAPEIVYFLLTVLAKIKGKQEAILCASLKRKLTTKRKLKR